MNPKEATRIFRQIPTIAGLGKYLAEDQNLYGDNYQH
jgi:hypothetical protein